LLVVGCSWVFLLLVYAMAPDMLSSACVGWCRLGYFLFMVLNNTGSAV
jgi:hypothetical protein